MGWFPLHPELEPLDQGYDDVPGSPIVSRWGQVGPEGGRGQPAWSWTIRATDDAGDQWDEASGFADTEAEAKAAVEGWRPPGIFDEGFAPIARRIMDHAVTPPEPCDSCADLPGILPTESGPRIYVERCDACDLYAGDLDAAYALAQLVGGTVTFYQYDPAIEARRADGDEYEVRTFDGTYNEEPWPRGDQIAYGTDVWIAGADPEMVRTVQAMAAAVHGKSLVELAREAEGVDLRQRMESAYDFDPDLVASQKAWDGLLAAEVAARLAQKAQLIDDILAGRGRWGRPPDWLSPPCATYSAADVRASTTGLFATLRTQRLLAGMGF